MINEIVKLISPKIIALPWVERYGGLVRTAVRQVNVNVAEDREDRPIWQRQAYPVSCEVSGTDCWDNGRYMDLLPNEGVKSIVYFEELTGMTFNGLDATYPGRVKVQNWTGEVRLIAWINQPALGMNECSISADIAGSLLNALMSNGGKLTGHPWQAYVKMEVIGQEPKTNGLFARYTYDPQSELLFYPFDFVALRVRLTMQVNANCIPDFTPAEPVTCIDYTGPIPEEGGEGED